MAAAVACSSCIDLHARLKVAHEHGKDLERKLEDVEATKEELMARLNEKMVELNDKEIKIRSLEAQLQSAIDRGVIATLTRADVDGIISRDLERIHTQLVYKDTKIMELNNTVLDKERQILDLQEMCREQGELVQAKAKAFHIIQDKLFDLDSKTSREEATETDPLPYDDIPSTSVYSNDRNQKDCRHGRDNASPGRAVVHLRFGSSGSPPPLDPSEDRSSLTHEVDDLEGDEKNGDVAGSVHKKKQRKKVTFDLPPRRERRAEGEDDNIAQAIIDLTTENDQLRQTIQDLERCATGEQKRADQLEMELEKVRRDGRNQLLKTRAAMQSTTRDLEARLKEYTEKVGQLNASIEMLRADREWTLSENDRLLKLLSSFKEKLNDTWESFLLKQNECDKLRAKLSSDRALVVALADDLEDAHHNENALTEQKILILNDVDRLKEALEAQDEYIELLEADTVIYEEHIGLLRDSLGASKVEKRALIKSKAFEAKLKALEREKEQMSKKRANERLHIKALSLKITSLEAENAELVSRSGNLEARLAQITRDGSTGPLKLPGSAFTVLSEQAKSSDSTQVEMRDDSLKVHQQELLAMDEVNVSRADERQLLEDMQREMDNTRYECNSAQERIVQLECENFELEKELKETKERLKSLVNEYRELDEAHSACCSEQERRDLEVDCAAKLNELEMIIAEMRKEMQHKDEKLAAVHDEKDRRQEVMQQWRFAVGELETVHGELKCLEDQLNMERAAMESRWTEVQAMLMERDNDNSRKTTRDDSSSPIDQSLILKQSIETIEGLKNTIAEQEKKIELNRVEKRKLKAAIRMFQSEKEKQRAHEDISLNQLDQTRTRAEELMWQIEFLDDEIARLNLMNFEKDVKIAGFEEALDRARRSTKSPLSNLSNDKMQAKITQLCSQETILAEQTEIERTDLTASGSGNNSHVFPADIQPRIGEEDALVEHRVELEVNAPGKIMSLNENDKDTTCQADFVCTKLPENGDAPAVTKSVDDVHEELIGSVREELRGIDSSLVELLIAHWSSMVERLRQENAQIQLKVGEIRMELAEQVQAILMALQVEYKQKQLLNKEIEAHRLKNDELSAALNSVNAEMKRRSEEKDEIIEVLQSQHTHLSEMLRQYESDESTPKTAAQQENSTSHARNASTETEPSLEQNHGKAVQTEFIDGLIDESAVSSVEIGTNTSVVEEKDSQLFFQEVAIQNESGILESENEILRECVYESSRVQDSLSDVQHLVVLNAELETAVEMLKGEIWSLNEQLRTSLADREELSDKLCELSQRHEEERAKAHERERELEEQKDMAEKSQRQAALAENESNCRLVEWQEKSAEMERGRAELEDAYVKLTGYYEQLQEAYNALYASAHAQNAELGAHADIKNKEMKERMKKLEEELSVRKRELEERANELQKLRELLSVQRQAALLFTSQLRQLNLKSLKEIVEESVRMIRSQLEEASEEVRARAASFFDKWQREKRMKDENIKNAVEKLIAGIFPERSTLSSAGNSLTEVVHAVHCEFAEKIAETEDLKRNLENERKERDELERQIRKLESEKDDESASKVAELEELLEATQISLTEHLDRCQHLQAKLDELGTMAGRGNPSAAEAERGAATLPRAGAWPCTICRDMLMVLAKPTTPQLQLAILAARLTTKIADNDALIRCNNELAECNHRLQNELDELKAQIRGREDITNDRRSESFYEQNYDGKQAASEEGTTENWNWDPDDTDKKDAIEQETEVTALRKIREDLLLQVERLEKRLEVSEDYCYQLESELDELRERGAETRRQKGIIAMAEAETQDDLFSQSVVEERHSYNEMEKLLEEQEFELANTFAQVEILNKLYENEQAKRKTYEKECELARKQLSETIVLKDELLTLTKLKENLETKVVDLEEQLRLSHAKQVDNDQFVVQKDRYEKDDVIKMLTAENNSLKVDLQTLLKNIEELKTEQETSANYYKELEDRNVVLERSLAQAHSEHQLSSQSVKRVRMMRVSTEERFKNSESLEVSGEQNVELSEIINLPNVGVSVDNDDQLPIIWLSELTTEPQSVEQLQGNGEDLRQEGEPSKNVSLSDLTEDSKNYAGKSRVNYALTQTEEIGTSWDVWGDRDEGFFIDIDKLVKENVLLKEEVLRLRKAVENSRQSTKLTQECCAELVEQTDALQKLYEENLSYESVLQPPEELPDGKARADLIEASAQTSEPDDFWDAASDSQPSAKDVEIRNLTNENFSIKSELQTLRKVLDGVKQKLYLTEEYSSELEEKNMELERKLSASPSRNEPLRRSEKINASLDCLRDERCENFSLTNDTNCDVFKTLQEQLIAKEEEADNLRQQIFSMKKELQCVRESSAEKARLQVEYGEKQRQLQLTAEKIREEARFLSTEIGIQKDEFKREARDIMDQLTLVQEKFLVLEHALTSCELKQIELQRDYDSRLLELAELKNTDEKNALERLGMDQKLDELRLQLEAANEIGASMRRALQELRQQNELLQDSECRFMESVDRYASECERLKNEKQQLERELKRNKEKGLGKGKDHVNRIHEIGVQCNVESKESAHAATTTDSIILHNDDEEGASDGNADLVQSLPALQDKRNSQQCVSATTAEMGESSRVQLAPFRTDIIIADRGTDESVQREDMLQDSGQWVTNEDLDDRAGRTVQQFQRICAEHHLNVDEYNRLTRQLKECEETIRKELLDALSRNLIRTSRTVASQISCFVDNEQSEKDEEDGRFDGLKEFLNKEMSDMKIEDQVVRSSSRSPEGSSSESRTISEVIKLVTASTSVATEMDTVHESECFSYTSRTASKKSGLESLVINSLNSLGMTRSKSDSQLCKRSSRSDMESNLYKRYESLRHMKTHKLLGVEEVVEAVCADKDILDLLPLVAHDQLTEFADRLRALDSKVNEDYEGRGDGDGEQSDIVSGEVVDNEEFNSEFVRNTENLSYDHSRESSKSMRTEPLVLSNSSDSSSLATRSHKAEEIIICQLQEDNVKLEEELMCAHEKLARLKDEFKKCSVKQNRIECELRDVKLQNCSLTREVSRLKTALAVSQTKHGSKDVIDLKEKLEANEKQHRETEAQLISDLCEAETKLAMKEGYEEALLERMNKAEANADKWQRKYEEACGEIETLKRFTDETRNLERVLHDERLERQELQEMLHRRLDELKILKDAKDHLSEMICQANVRIAESEKRLQQSNAGRMQLSNKVAELERRLQVYQEAVDLKSLESEEMKHNPEVLKTGDISALRGGSSLDNYTPPPHLEIMTHNSSVGSSENVSGESARIPQKESHSRNVVFDLWAAEEGQADTIGTPQTSRLYLLDDEEDYRRSKRQFIAASAPFPSFLERLRRFIRSAPHQQRSALRMLYKILIYAYVLVLHFAIFMRCSLW